MIHYGDVQKIKGAEVPKVDVITFGAPCQDLSVAGKRAGMKSVLMGDEENTRSGLFFEAIRIIKEMREDDRRNDGRTDNTCRPRYAVYENVAGAFSSNKGEDFRAVLEQTAKVADENAYVPGLEGGKWSPCGCILGNGWSIAWRLHDAQYYGVPQRRKRICLLADFNGDSAGRILFELQRKTAESDSEQTVLDIGKEPEPEIQSVSEGLSGNTEESRKAGKDVAEDIERCAGEAGGIYDVRISSDGTKNWRAHCYETDKSRALDTGGEDPDSNHGGIAVVAYGISSYDSNAMKSDNPHSGIYEADTSRTLDLNCGNPGCNQGGMAVVQGADMYNGAITGDIATTLNASSGNSPTHSGPSVVCLEGNGQRESHKGDGYKESDTMYTLNTVEQHAVCVKNPSVVNVEMEVSVRKYEVDKNRLIECLQKHKTMPLQKIAEALNVQKTMVEHWFRKDSCFSVPDADIWPQLKTLLNIDTDEFDESIMTYEVKPGNYDTRNRIHMGDVAPTLNTQSENTVYCLENHPADSRVKIADDGKVQTLSSRMETGGGNVPMVMSLNSKQQALTTGEEIASSLGACDYKEPQAVCIGNGQTNQSVEEKTGSINCMHDQQAVITYGLDRASFNMGQNAKYNFSVEEEKIGAQVAREPRAVCQSVVRRLTPLECERLQGFPTVRKVRFTEMTKDEYIAWNINEGNIVVDTEYGKVFATRGPGGVKLDEPKELMGSVVNGYKVVSIRNGDTKMQCRIHRIIWIAAHGIIPDGYVVDHINNNKMDNRLENLQLLTAGENSTKARNDGLYKVHDKAGQAKISDEVHDFIQYMYDTTDLTCKQLAEIFGISKSRVHQIIHDESWTDIGDWIDSKGKTHKGESDSPRYKALGNSIALPFWQWMAERMMPYLGENPTMASLFSGIGGFELVFSRVGCKPVWASEVENFAIAVTKKRFPEE